MEEGGFSSKGEYGILAEKREKSRKNDLGRRTCDIDTKRKRKQRKGFREEEEMPEKK
jgi:hypothetical protein